MIEGRGVLDCVRTCGFDCGFHRDSLSSGDICRFGCRLKIRFLLSVKLCSRERKQRCGPGDGV